MCNSSKIDFNEGSGRQNEKKKSRLDTKVNVPGSVTRTIGTGENAKNSIAFLTIQKSFCIGIVLSILIIIHCTICCMYFYEKPDYSLLSDILLSIWNVLVPIITLSLGYVFGYTRRSK